MSASSWAKKLIRMPNSAFTAGAPMSAAQAFLVRNNIAHLIDESCQHRINWAGAGSSSASISRPIITRGHGVDKLFYQQEFPLSFLGPSRPANLALVVVYEGVDDTDSEGDNDILARAVICPASSPRDSKQNAIFDQVGNAASGAAGFAAALIDCSEHVATLNSAYETVGLVNEGGIWFGPQLCMLRLEVSVSFTRFVPLSEEPITADYVRILGVSLLEYA